MEPGLTYKCYEGNWDSLPEVIISAPSYKGVVDSFGIPQCLRYRKTGYIIVYDGYIQIDQDGDYNFCINTVAGRRLKVDGKTIINNNHTDTNPGFPLAIPYESRGVISLKKGTHPIHLVFNTNRFTSNPFLKVEYGSAVIEAVEIPSKILYHHQTVPTSRPVLDNGNLSKGTSPTLNLILRSQVIDKDKQMLYWRVVNTPVQWRTDETLIIIKDMWNKHWCFNGADIIQQMFPRFNEVIHHARSLGVQIVHVPSSPAIHSYHRHPSYDYMLKFPQFPLPEFVDHDDYPMPLNVDDAGANGPILEIGRQPDGYSQIKDIDIVFETNGLKDGICETFELVWNMMVSKDIKNVILTGCATNMCLMNKPLGIRNLVSHGINVVVVRDMTNPMYNPASPPYVNMPEANKMMSEYFEKFWCPTIGSDEILSSEKMFDIHKICDMVVS